MSKPSRRAAMLQAGAASLLAAALLAGSGAPGALAQGVGDWPAKPVRLVVNFQAGGGTDVVARPFAERLSRLLGQQMVVDNKGGASGAIGVEQVIKSPPDGYTFLISPSLTVAILPHLRKLSFDPLKDIVPVSAFGEGTLLIAMNSAVPASNIQELIAYAKANPGKLSWGTPGVGSFGHLICETFKHHAGVDILHVPYRGTGEVMPDFLANVVQLQADPITLQHVPTGKAKLLATFGRQRRPDYPNVPMMKEIFPEMDFIVWLALFAPVGTPPAIVARMAEASSKVAQDEELRKQLFELAFTPTPATPEETRALLEKDFALYGRITKQFNIRSE